MLHHIMIRGIEHRKIFLNTTDYEDLLDRLSKLLPETQTVCYAWSLMPNHAHFLFCTGKRPIATLMRRLLTGYAVSFNRRHRRDGRLFQNRYKSIICQEDAYLTGGGLIRSLGGWSEVKKHRGKTSEHTMSDERILGDGLFVDSVITQADEAFDHRYELKRGGYDLERIAERVGEILDIKKEDVLSKGSQKTKVKARSMLCYWAVRETGMSIRSLAKRLGMSAPGVGYAVERGAAIIRENQYSLIP
jgi:REP element-mobilizing transposase RayT